MKPSAREAAFIDDMLSGRLALPMMPRVVLVVLEALRRDDVSLTALAADLETDPVLSSRILRLANSSHFMGRRNVSSIGEAVATVGLGALQTLVVACGAQAAFAEVPGVNLAHFWHSATTSATAARQIARRARIDGDAAYAAALLQAIGHLILCRALPARALAEFGSLRTSWGRELAERERRAFEVTHPRISAIWVDRIGLPHPVVQAVAQSLDPVGADRSADERLAWAVQLACAMTAAITAGDDDALRMGRAEAPLVAALGLDDYLASDDFATDFAQLSAIGAAA